MNYLILTVIGGILLFGIMYFLPLKMKPLHKLGYVIISLSLANLFLYTYTLLGIWQSATIVFSLNFLSTYFISKKTSSQHSTNSEQEPEKGELKVSSEEINEICLEENLNQNIIAPRNDEQNKQLIVDEEYSSEAGTTQDSYQIDVDESELFERRLADTETIDGNAEESIEAAVEQDSLEPSSEVDDILSYTDQTEEETSFDNLEVIEEIIEEEQVKDDLQREIKIEKKEKLNETFPEFNEDEEVFFNREVSSASDEEIAVTVEEMPTNEEKSLSRENLFFQLETEDAKSDADDRLGSETLEEEVFYENSINESNSEIESESESESIQPQLEILEELEPLEEPLETDEQLVTSNEVSKTSTKPRMNRLMRDVFIEQLQWMKGRVSVAEFEEVLQEYRKEEFNDQDYYIFSSILRDLYIETEQFYKLEQLFTKLKGRFSNKTIIWEEILFFEKKFL